MTVQLDTAGPGVEDYRSSKFAATVNTTPVYVYAHAEASDQASVSAWNQGDSPEQSWLMVNTDETVTVAITNVDASPITSALFYPPDSGAESTVSGGTLTLTVPANTRLRVEIEGDRAEALHIFTAPVLTTPATRTDYTTLAVAITSIADGAGGFSTVTCEDGHGLSEGDRILIKSTGTLPLIAGTAISAYEALHVTVLDATTFQLGTTASGTDITFSGNGTGSLSFSPATYQSDASSLYFPAGVHVLGKMFAVGSGVDVYLDAGAVVIGNFDIRNTELAAIRGRGLLLGTFASWIGDGLNVLSDSVLMASYPMFVGYDAPDFAAENAVNGIVVAACPFYVNNYGVWSFRNLHVISCWHGKTDGFAPNPRSNAERVSEIVDCFVFSGDDAIKLRGFDTETVSGTFAITTANTPYMLGYFPSAPSGYARTINDCHAMHLGSADTGGDVTYPYDGMNAIIKAWVDGWESQTDLGVFDVTISNFRVWGEMPSRLLSIGNRAYPFSGVPSRDQAGQIQRWSLSNIVTEFVPGQISQIIGRDASNAPTNLTFADIRLGTVEVDSSNFTTYFDVSQFASGVVWDEPDANEVVEPSTFVVEDGSGKSDANSYSTIEFADQYWLNRGSPVAWSGATVAARQNALRQGTFYLDDVYGGVWRGTISTLTQSLTWPRVSAADADNGLVYYSDAIPTRLKEAACEVALRHISGIDLRPDLAAGVDNVKSTSFSIGPISISETFAGSQGVTPRFPVVESKLRGLLSYGVGGYLMRVTR